MGDELLDSAPNAVFADHQNPPRAFRFARENPAFCESVQIRRSGRKLDRFLAGRLQYPVERGAVLAIAVVDDVLHFVQKANTFHCLVPCNLFHPRLVRVCRNASQVNASAGMVQKEQDAIGHQGARRDRFDCEKVGRRSIVHVVLDEVTPPDFLTTLWARRYSVANQDLLDSGFTERNLQLTQLSADV
jgi:hypothetical protein